MFLISSKIVGKTTGMILKMQQFDGFHDLVHEDLCLDEPRVGVARHPVRDHAGERDDGLGHLPVRAVDRCRRGIQIRLHTVCFYWDRLMGAK